MSELPSTIIGAATALRARRLSSAELVNEALARADALDEQLGVYVTRFDDDARAAARRADGELAAGDDRGPLHGIPVGVKDIIAAREGPTTAQSRVLDPAWGRARDATVVERLRAAGAIVIGKLTTMEFAAGLPDLDWPFPTPRNPWNLDAWTGGSSSGAGAAIAAGLLPAAIGTDTGGSIRMPAAFCGVSGLMPTYGRVSTAGCVPLAYTLDHVGPLARTARDCGAVLAAIAGTDDRDPATEGVPQDGLQAGSSVPVSELRIGVDRIHHTTDDDDPAAAAVLQAALDTLSSLGVTVTDISLPHHAETVTAHLVTLVCEALCYHRQDLRSRWSDYSAATRSLVAAGALFSGADYVQAQRVRRAAQRALAATLAEVDVIVTPTATAGAPTYPALRQHGLVRLSTTIHTGYWDAVGNPVLSVPMGFTEAGMPLGLQLAGRPFEEALLVELGDAYQQATDWHLRVPPLRHAAPTARETSAIARDDHRMPADAPPPAAEALLAAAGLAPAIEETTALDELHAALRPSLDAMHALSAARDESPATLFRATPPPRLWGA